MSGTPVIASDIGGVREVVKGGEFLFRAGDKKGLYDRIYFFIENKDKLKGFTIDPGLIKDIRVDSREMEEMYRRLIEHNNIAQA